MKVLAGSLKGQSFAQPPTRSVRPLSEKVRAAIFDVLGPVDGLVILDAYAGSGAAGFEALSRGALMVEAIEANARVARLIAANADSLGLGMTHVLHQMTVGSWLASPAQTPPTRRYDVIIADPPYSQLDEETLSRLAHFCRPGGIIAISRSGKLSSPMIESCQLVREKSYGDTTVSFFRAREDTSADVVKW